MLDRNMDPCQQRHAAQRTHQAKGPRASRKKARSWLSWVSSVPALLKPKSVACCCQEEPALHASRRSAAQVAVGSNRCASAAAWKGGWGNRGCYALFFIILGDALAFSSPGISDHV